jgi:hypothetical protein
VFPPCATAFSAESLRRSAASFEGSKMARRKHQIGTLLFNARMQELDQLEKRTQGQKSKAETVRDDGAWRRGGVATRSLKQRDVQERAALGLEAYFGTP